MTYKRILKTGALAVAVTIAFAIFVFRAAEWTKGLNSEMVVLGQGTSSGGGGSTGGGNTCSTGSTGTGGVQNVKVLPQMAMNSFDDGRTKYTTVVQIVNTSGAAQSVSGSFFNEDGTAMTGITLTAGTTTITNGVLPATSLAKDALLVITGGGTPAAGVIGWGKISVCGGVSISTFFELRDGTTNVLYSRVGVAASPANLGTFIVPRVREVSTGLDVGFALVNTGSTPADLKAELKDASGNTIATETLPFGPGVHTSTFTYQLFKSLTDGANRSYQYVKFSSASPSFAAIALAFEGANQTSFPVDALQ